MRRHIGQAKVKLFGGIMPKEPFWDVSPDSYAQGLSTDKGERFRGKHSQNMLFIFDEANGIPNFAWEEADNMCTAPNNKILAIANPIIPSGPFFDCFKANSDWATMTLSCLDHPNVVQGREVIPGAVSWKWVNERVRKFCMPIDSRDFDKKKRDFEWPRGSGKLWRPIDPAFCCRVLGEFPDEGPNTLIPLSQLDYARNKNRIPIDDTSPVDIGVDVAYKGGDWAIAYSRRGPCVLERIKYQGLDPTKYAQRIGVLIRGYNEKGIKVGTVAVDTIGMGLGVWSDLVQMKTEGTIKCDRILAIQVSERSSDPARIYLKRDELALTLAERFHQEGIDLSRLPEEDYADFESQASAIEWGYTRILQMIVDSKDVIRDRIGRSPDDFDAMVLAFIDTVDNFAANFAMLMSVD